MIGIITRLLGMKFAPWVVLIAAAALLGFTGAVSLSNAGLRRENSSLTAKLAEANARAQTCETWRKDLATESGRRKDETAKALALAQGAVQAAQKAATAISAPLTAVGACARADELAARIREGRR